MLQDEYDGPRCNETKMTQQGKNGVKVETRQKQLKDVTKRKQGKSCSEQEKHTL